MNKFWLWFRLLIGNRGCFNFWFWSCITSFSMILVWLFTVPACRVLGASDYWKVLAAVLVYTSICKAVWFVWFMGSWFMSSAAGIPGVHPIHHVCHEYIEWSSEERAHYDELLKESWLKSLVPNSTPSEVDVYERYKHIITNIRITMLADEGIELYLWIYFDVMVCLLPTSLVAILPFIIVRTRSYGATLGFMWAFIGLFVVATIVIIVIGLILWKIARVVWAVTRRIGDHFVATYCVAAAITDGFSPVGP